MYVNLDSFFLFFFKEVKKESKEAKDVRSEPKEEASHATRRDKSSGNVANLVQRMSTIGLPTGGFQPHPPPTAKSKRQPLSVAAAQGSTFPETHSYFVLNVFEHLVESVSPAVGGGLH